LELLYLGCSSFFLGSLLVSYLLGLLFLQFKSCLQFFFSLSFILLFFYPSRFLIGNFLCFVNFPFSFCFLLVFFPLGRFFGNFLGLII